MSQKQIVPAIQNSKSPEGNETQQNLGLASAIDLKVEFKQDVEDRWSKIFHLLETAKPAPNDLPTRL